MRGLLELLFLYLLQTQDRSYEISKFSQTNIAVDFNPFVAVNDIGDLSSYNADQHIPMISKIASTFNKIMMGTINENTGSTVELIPTAVAKFNKENKDPNYQPMELLLPFEMAVLKNGTGMNFNIAKILADEANQVYPGTVRWMYLDCRDFEDGVKYIENYLVYIQNRLSGTEYMIGAILQAVDCGTGRFHRYNYFSELLPYLKEIMLISGPTGDHLLGEPHSAALHVTKSVERCMQKIQNYDQNVSFQLYTYWVYNRKTDVVTHNNKLVAYWLLINDWATQTNVSAVLNGAFDIPKFSMDFANIGWWRLIEDSYQNSSQYVFEEKLDSLMNMSWGIKQIWPFVVGALLFVTILVASGLWWKPLCRKLERLYSTHEVNEFYEGTTKILEGGLGGPLSQIQQVPYNKGLELSKSQFTVDMNLLLGSGVFGAVYEGSVTRSNVVNEEVKVAVKTTMSSSPSTARTSLLSEIKVLSYLGKHDNIVNIVGAYTKGIRKGKVYVFLELCELGSLEKHLRENILLPQEEPDVDQFTPVSNAHYYTDLTPRDSNAEEMVEVPSERHQNPCTTGKIASNASDLHRWAFEIANGMEFLASKSVVHADLATRNVLLTRDKRAKISDFGLSRRLYDYEMYVKTQQEPLPWRWMAPESLRCLEFNEKTDVSSFGVTLWEINALGDIPFEGLSWTPNFSSQLAQGLRLQEPTFRVEGMYSHMLKCWNMEPSKRQTFSELKVMLQDPQYAN